MEEGPKMATLSNPHLKITLVSGTHNVHVEASVEVTFTAFELALMQQFDVKGRLRCVIRGDDPIFNDNLFSFSVMTVKTNGPQIFSSTVPRSVLNEDLLGRDEVFARFTLSSSESAFPMNATARSANIKAGL
jgi:hypothetical protein